MHARAERVKRVVHLRASPDVVGVMVPVLRPLGMAASAGCGVASARLGLKKPAAAAAPGLPPPCAAAIISAACCC